MLEAKDIFKSLSEQTEEATTKLNEFMNDRNLESGDYVGTLDYIGLDDSERIEAIDFTIDNADEDEVDMDSVDSVESLFYQEITNMSDSVAHILSEYAMDFMWMSDAIVEKNDAGQRELSERAMYELAKNQDDILGKLSDIYTTINTYINYNDVE